mmetsp:Transcript_96707/g.279169  ORF Transcript_96707/g.279169 Transcript_96707/m.279169 type:complete len:256 (-) Transcript_96707:252-1019(-)
MRRGVRGLVGSNPLWGRRGCPPQLGPWMGSGCPPRSSRSRPRRRQCLRRRRRRRFSMVAVCRRSGRRPARSTRRPPERRSRFPRRRRRSRRPSAPWSQVERLRRGCRCWCRPFFLAELVNSTVKVHNVLTPASCRRASWLQRSRRTRSCSNNSTVFRRTGANSASIGSSGDGSENDSASWRSNRSRSSGLLTCASSYGTLRLSRRSRKWCRSRMLRRSLLGWIRAVMSTPASGISTTKSNGTSPAPKLGLERVGA